MPPSYVAGGITAAIAVAVAVGEDDDDQQLIPLSIPFRLGTTRTVLLYMES